MNSADYINKIIELKTNYLDAKWNDGLGWYESDDGYGTGIIAYTLLNAYMLETIAILAGRGLASAVDISRAQSVITKLTTSPCFQGNTWSRRVSVWDNIPHASVDQPVAEALFFAWEYRLPLGLSSPDINTIFNIVAVDAVQSYGIYGGVAPFHSLQVTSGTTGNQITTRWKLHRVTYPLLMGDTSWGASLSILVKRFVQYMNSPNPFNGVSDLFPDFGWRYTNIITDFPSTHYAEVCLSGVLFFLPEIWAYLGLTASEIAKLKAWQRNLIGIWQLDGYLNQDDIWSSGRMHESGGWLFQIRALSGMVRGGNLLQNSADAQYAKYLFDEAINTHTSMDTWVNDPADSAISPYPMGVADLSLSGIEHFITKSSHTARLAMELAIALEMGVADAPSQAPPNLWTWGWYNKHLHISTPAYSAASLPKAPIVSGGLSGMDAVQLQHWGVSHIQVPRNLWLTGFGGYGKNAFSFFVSRNGITEINTSTGNASSEPATQNIYLDGVLQSRTDYDTAVIPDTFSTSIRQYCSKACANYLVEVDTTFYLDHITTIHSASLTGTSGTGIIYHSFPCRKNVVIDYVPPIGAKTVIWNGTTINTAGSPAPSVCKYIHLKWASWNKGLLLIPVAATVGAGAKVTVTSTAPSGYPKRQPDQDRSLLIYLADGAASMGNASLTYDIYVTDGTDAGAEAVYGTLHGIIYTSVGIMADFRTITGAQAPVYRI